MTEPGKTEAPVTEKYETDSVVMDAKRNFLSGKGPLTAMPEDLQPIVKRQLLTMNEATINANIGYLKSPGKENLIRTSGEGIPLSETTLKIDGLPKNTKLVRETVLTSKDISSLGRISELSPTYTHYGSNADVTHLYYSDEQIAAIGVDNNEGKMAIPEIVLESAARYNEEMGLNSNKNIEIPIVFTEREETWKPQ